MKIKRLIENFLRNYSLKSKFVHVNNNVCEEEGFKLLNNIIKVFQLLICHQICRSINFLECTPLSWHGKRSWERVV